MEEMKPCPFCGGEAMTGTNSKDIFGGHHVFCTMCECQTGYFGSEKEAIEAWNTRAEVKDE